jgi:hypothetical protein
MPPVGLNDSALLNRVKLFLPQIAKANEVLQQQINQQGLEAVQIDRGLKLGLSNSSQNISNEDDESDEEDEDDVSEADSENEIQMPSSQTPKYNQDLLQIEENIHNKGLVKAQQKKKPKMNKQGYLAESADTRTVQLEFAIGDVDQTTIALAEAEAEAEANDSKTENEEITLEEKSAHAVIFRQLAEH